MGKEVKYSPFSDNFLIEYKNIPHTRPMPPHTHNAAEIFVNLSYLPYVLLDSKVLPAPKDTLIIFPSYCVHKLSSLPDEPYERYVITADTLWLEKTLGNTELFSYLNGAREPLMIPLNNPDKKSLIEKCQEYLKYSPDDIFSRLAHFFSVMSEVNNIISGSSQKKQHISDKKISTANKTVNSVIEYINEHLYENLMIKDIAGHFYLNPDYMSRIFKKHTNTNINNYITMQRITAARRMLIDGKTISEAQQATGYLSYSHFFRVFKKETGMTPKEFKDMYDT